MLLSANILFLVIVSISGISSKSLTKMLDKNDALINVLIDNYINEHILNENNSLINNLRLNSTDNNLAKDEVKPNNQTEAEVDNQDDSELFLDVSQVRENNYLKPLASGPSMVASLAEVPANLNLGQVIDENLAENINDVLAIENNLHSDIYDRIKSIIRDVLFLGKEQHRENATAQIHQDKFQFQFN